MTHTGTTGHADFVVIGLGALGSATCLELARSSSLGFHRSSVRCGIAVMLPWASWA